MAHAQTAHFGLKEHSHGADDVIVSEQRLSHAHEDHIVDVGAEIGFHGGEMRDNFAGCQIAGKSLLPRGAEGAAKGAAHLRRNAGRIVVAVVHQNRLDVLSVRQSP